MDAAYGIRSGSYRQHQSLRIRYPAPNHRIPVFSSKDKNWHIENWWRLYSGAFYGLHSHRIRNPPNAPLVQYAALHGESRSSVIDRAGWHQSYRGIIPKVPHKTEDTGCRSSPNGHPYGKRFNAHGFCVGDTGRVVRVPLHGWPVSDDPRASARPVNLYLGLGIPIVLQSYVYCSLSYHPTH